MLIGVLRSTVRSGQMCGMKKQNLATGFTRTIYLRRIADQRS
jgi:hypothetical protein